MAQDIPASPPLSRARTRRAAIALSVLLSAAVAPRCTRCRAVASLDFTRVPVRRYPDVIPAGDRRIAVIADVQRTSFEECLIGREVNDRAQRALVGSLAREDVGAVVIVGDMVFLGASREHWGYFDWLVEPVRAAGLSVLPAVGNHEYFGDNADARERLRERFPRLADRTWYADRWGRVGLVWIDSNPDELGDAVWEQQQRWFGRTLAGFDADPSVRGVVVFLHHPPFTNSVLVSPDEAVQRDLVPGFCASRKTLAMVSGHAHGFERFVRGPADGCGDRPRQFIVSAGGGGPRPGSLRSEDETHLHDACTLAAPRPFNYLLLDQRDDGVRVTVRALSATDDVVRDLGAPIPMPFADDGPRPQ